MAWAESADIRHVTPPSACALRWRLFSANEMKLKLRVQVVEGCGPSGAIVSVVSVTIVIRARHRVVATGPPGIAACDALGGYPATFKGAVFLQGFQRIGAACGLIAAVPPHPRAEDQAIGPDRQG